jgi:hypothetical protein
MQWFDTVLSETQYEYVLNKTLLGNSWQFIGFSDGSTDHITFWYMDLTDDPFFQDEFLPAIERLTGKRFEIQRVYANGQTHGLPGDLHWDIDPDVYAPELYHTFNYYVNPVWDLRWGGQTVILHDDGVVDTVYPKRNTGLLFNSTLHHLGSEPSRLCKELRVTVAFKLKEMI